MDLEPTVVAENIKSRELSWDTEETMRVIDNDEELYHRIPECSTVMALKVVIARTFESMPHIDVNFLNVDWEHIHNEYRKGF